MASDNRPKSLVDDDKPSRQGMKPWWHNSAVLVLMCALVGDIPVGIARALVKFSYQLQVLIWLLLSMVLYGTVVLYIRRKK